MKALARISISSLALLLGACAAGGPEADGDAEIAATSDALVARAASSAEVDLTVAAPTFEIAEFGTRIAAKATAPSLGYSVGGLKDPTLFVNTIRGHRDARRVVDEVTVTPAGEWVIVAGTNVVASASFPAAALAKVQSFIAAGKRIDVIAVTPQNYWVVIAENLRWYSSQDISHYDTLRDKVAEYIASGARIDDLAFDTDGNGWVLVSGGKVYAKAIRQDLFDVLVDRGPAKRRIKQIAMGPAGSWVVVGDDWFASRAAPQLMFDWLRGWQRDKRGFDFAALGPGGAWLLYSNDAFSPNPASPISKLEYGLPNGKSIHERMQELKIPGASIAIVDDNKVTWARGYGELEAGTQRAVLTTSPFDAASLSKAVASVGALALVDDPGHALTLDEDVKAVAARLPGVDRIQQWMNGATVLHGPLPALPNGINLRRLLSHTASVAPIGGSSAVLASEGAVTGLQYALGWDCWGPLNNRECGFQKSRLVWFDPSLGAPGSTSEYSGGGFQLAHLMLEAEDGRPFAEMMRERVLDPIGMEHSTFVQPLDPASRAIVAYPHNADGTKLAQASLPSYPGSAAGGLYTPPSDYARALVTIMREGLAPSGQRIMSVNSARQMLTDQTPTSGFYGFGVGLSETEVRTNDVGASFSHTGAHSQARTRFLASPGRKEAIVVMVNSGGDDAATFLSEVVTSFRCAYGWNGC